MLVLGHLERDTDNACSWNACWNDNAEGPWDTDFPAQGDDRELNAMELTAFYLICRELPARRHVQKFVEEARNHTRRKEQGVHDEALSEHPCDPAEE